MSNNENNKEIQVTDASDNQAGAGGDKEMKEYVTFTDTTKSGREIELAVIEEFEFENKLYVVGALVRDDTVYDEDLFIYRLLLKGEEDYSVEKIEDPKEYERIAKVYIEM